MDLEIFCLLGTRVKAVSFSEVRKPISNTSSDKLFPDYLALFLEIVNIEPSNSLFIRYVLNSYNISQNK